MPSAFYQTILIDSENWVDVYHLLCKLVEEGNTCYSE